MDFRVLGPVSVEVAGAPVSLGGQRQRSLLAVLLMARGQTIGVHALVDALWDENPPASAEGSLQVAVSRLRKTIGPDHVTTMGGGYRLDVAQEDLDLARFETHVQEGSRRAERGDLEAAAVAWHDALAEWRGQALGGVADTPSLRAQATGLEEQRLAVLERWLSAEVDLGRRATALPVLEQLTQEHPYRESLHGLMMRALYLDGRQADALNVARRLRSSLSEDLGIDLSVDLEVLERDMLNHAATLQPANSQPSLRGLRSEFPPLRALGSASSFPALTTETVGRDGEIDELTAMLSVPRNRLVTLTGPGGTGKTRLAVAVAERLAEEIADEIHFVDLAAITQPELVMPTVAHVLDVADSSDRSGLDAIRAHLGDRPTLIVLDNFEQVIGAAAQVAELLRACPALHLLVTSREPLRVTGEQQYPVLPLTAPTIRTLPGKGLAAEAMGFDAVKLFVERARSAKPSFGIDDDNARAVAEICARVDGLPLAIELAAGRVKVLAPHAIAERLEQRLPLLTRGSRSSPARHQTMRAAIEWSHELLSDRERILFALLAVFVDGWLLETAEQVCGVVLPSVDVLDELTSLVDKNLVNQLDGDGEPRFRMLATVNEYAREQLERMQVKEALRDAHVVYFARLAEDAMPRMEGEGGEQWSQRLDKEHENIRAAVEWATRRGQEHNAYALVCGAWRAWLRHGRARDGQAITRMVLDAFPASESSERAEAELALSEIYRARGSYQAAWDISSSVLPIIEREFPVEAAIVQSDMANLADELGRGDEAALLYADALTRARALGDPGALAHVAGSFSWYLLRTGDLECASSLAKESCALARTHGDAEISAYSEWCLAETCRRRGERRKARGHLRQALQAAHRLGDLMLSLDTLASAAHLTGGLGEHERAAILLGSVDLITTSTGFAPFLPAETEAVRAAAEAGLGVQAFAIALGEGRRMQPRDALTYALGVLDDEGVS